MDIDNRSVMSGNYHTLTIVTPVAHAIPGDQEIAGGELIAGEGNASIVSDGYYDGERVRTDDKVILSTVETEGYYKITANGKGEVNRTPITKQITKAGFFDLDQTPVEVIQSETIESENAEKPYYIKKSTLTDDRITPSSSEQVVSISDGYYPETRTVTINAVTETYPTTSLDTGNLSEYFYSANQSDYDIRITPQYSNRAGYVIAHENANNGGIVYFKIKHSTVTELTTAVSGNNVIRGKAEWNNGWITSGQIAAASFKNAATAGKNYVDISETLEAPVLQSGDYLYINAGYTDDLKISLAKLVPDSGSSDITANYILNGYKAYNNEGALVTGNILTYDGSYTIT